MQTETNLVWSNLHSPTHDWLPKNAQRKKIRESILSNGCPLEWQRFCQKLLHFGPFCISLNFEVSQFWKVELIRDFFIYFSTFFFSAPCVGGVSFVAEKLKSGESLKAVWLSGQVALDSFSDDPAFKPSTLLCFLVVLSSTPSPRAVYSQLVCLCLVRIFKTLFFF